MTKSITLLAAAGVTLSMLAGVTIVSTVALTAASSTAQAKQWCDTRGGRQRCYGTPDPVPPTPQPNGTRQK